MRLGFRIMSKVIIPHFPRYLLQVGTLRETGLVLFLDQSISQLIAKRGEKRKVAEIINIS